MFVLVWKPERAFAEILSSKRLSTVAAWYEAIGLYMM
jgi:hypothetical protein